MIHLRCKPLSWTAVLTAFSFVPSIFLAGCGSSTTSSPSGSATGQKVALFLTGTTSTGGSATTKAQANVRAAASGSSSEILSLSLTLTGIQLTNKSGSTISILSSPVTFDASSLNGIASAVTIASIPEDSYVSATLTYSKATVSYVNSSGATVTTDATLTNTSTTFTFPFLITISSTTNQFVVDLLVAQSVSISGSTVTVTPDFTIDFNQGSGSWTGPEQTFGVISALGTNSFTLTTGFNTNITIDVNSSTTYTGVSGFSALAVGDAVQLSLSTQSNGALLATSVAVQQTGVGTGTPPGPGTPPQALSILTGPVTSVAGSPLSSFDLILQQGLGGSLTSGTTYTVGVDSSTSFVVPGESELFPGLPFTPHFTAANLSPGQIVLVATSSVSGTKATAQMVTLAPQTVTGTVASVTTAGSYTVYTVTLPSSSSLVTLSGASTVTVYVRTNQTQWGNSSPITTGSTVLFNGLLFNDGGTLRMVAGFGAMGWF